MRTEVDILPDADPQTPVTAKPLLPASLTAMTEFAMTLDQEGGFFGLNKDGEWLAAHLGRAPGEEIAGMLRETAAQVGANGVSATRNFNLADRGTSRTIEVTLIATDTASTLIVGRDATLDVNMRAALIESRQRYKDLVEISSDFAWETADGVFTFVSARGALGYPAKTLVGMAARQLLLDAESAPEPAAFETVEPVEREEFWLKDAGGQPVCVLVSARPLHDRVGKVKRVRGVCRDITAERLREHDLTRHKVREQVIDFIVDAIRDEAKPANMLTTAVTSLGRSMTATSCAVYQISESDNFVRAARYGKLPDGRRLSAALKRHRGETEIAAQKIAGRQLLIVATQYHGHTNGAVILSRPKSEPQWDEEDRLLLKAVAGQLGIALQQIADQQELLRLSRTDPLTGLLNRRAFLEELSPAMERARRNRTWSAILYIDLNNFKAVNDTHGHEEGDRVLRKLSEILRGTTRNYDYIVRLGGDEFAIWIENVSKEAAERRADTIMEHSQALSNVSADAEQPLGLSIGIAVFRPDSEESPQALLKRADAAMYRAKKMKRKNRAFTRETDDGR